MSPHTFLLADAAVAIVGLVLLITRLRLHPFIALTLAALFLGLSSGMPVQQVLKAYQDGFGSVLGFVGVVLALGTMLGKMMAESGGAHQIASTLVGAFGQRRVHWAMLCAASLVGLPLFFEIGFVLLIPLVFIVAVRTGLPVLKVGIPLLAGLSVLHGLVPPHPGPLLAIGVFGADTGKTILYGLLVGLPTAVIAGPLFGSFISRHVRPEPPEALLRQLAQPPQSASLPGFGTTLATVLLPVALMLLKAAADVLLAEGHVLRQWMDFIGHPITALLAALLLALHTFGTARGFGKSQMLRFLDDSLTPTAAIVVVIGAGGAFKQMLVASGVGDAIGHMAVQTAASPVVLAWLVAALIRIATGSATVATITGAGIVAPIAALVPGVNRELLVLATGAGSLIFSHVNDAGFWLVKQYFNMSVAETFKTWSAMETILSVVGLAFILCLQALL